MLDMGMPNVSGVELAKMVRARYDYRSATLVFVISYWDYAKEAVQLEPFRYIHKIDHRTTVGTILLDVAALYCDHRPMYEFTASRTPRLVPLEDIYYIQSDDRMLILYYWEGNDVLTVKYYGALRTEIKKLPPSQFFSPTASYIVAFDSVKKLNEDGLLLTDGTLIPIPRGQIKKTREMLWAHWGIEKTL